MRVPADIADAFVRHLEAAESRDPGHYIAFDEVISILRDLGSSTSDPVLIAQMLVELERRDWIESRIKGHIPADNSVRITAKGQNRAAASIDYADHFRRAVGSLPLAPDDIDVRPAGEQGGFVHDTSHAVTSSEPTITARGGTIDSTRWTGTKLVLTDENALRQIRRLSVDLRDKVHSMRIESNSDSQDLKGLTEALVSVCGMAVPELSIIERILAHPKFMTSAKLVAAVATIRGALGI